MQNIQTTTDETTNTQRTLADYLAARGEELRQDIERAEEKKRQEGEAERERYLANFSDVMETRLSRGLRAALNLSEPVYTTERDGIHGDYYTKVEASFTHAGETWTLRYWGGHLSLIDPANCQISLVDEWTEKGWKYSRSLLDAIQGYPQRQQEEQTRADEEAAREAEEAAADTKADGPIHYTYTEGSNAKYHLLHAGAQVCVSYPRYYGEDGAAVWGTVATFDKHWLLLTLATGRQMLINRRHIESIEPLYPDQQRAEQTANSLNADMTSDNVPF